MYSPKSPGSEFLTINRERESKNMTKEDIADLEQAKKDHKEKKTIPFDEV
jgi:hypothetical protein